MNGPGAETGVEPSDNTQPGSDGSDHQTDTLLPEEEQPSSFKAEGDDPAKEQDKDYQ